MTQADKQQAEQIQEQVRQKWNSAWRDHLKHHRDWIRSGRTTSKKVKWALKGG